MQGDCSAAQRQLELPLNVHGEECRSCQARDCSEDMEVGGDGGDLVRLIAFAAEAARLRGVTGQRSRARARTTCNVIAVGDGIAAG